MRPLPNRTYPLLILTGEEDNDLAKRMAKSWHMEEPQSKFHRIEKAGHCAHMLYRAYKKSPENDDL